MPVNGNAHRQSSFYMLKITMNARRTSPYGMHGLRCVFKI